jgi:hypothetical protein
MTPELERAIANARTAFARYKLGGRITVCSCPSCVGPAQERALVATPRDQISAELLAEYTHSAHGWDERVAEDFRYFLPRYFELIAIGQTPAHFGPELGLARLANVAYREQWPQAEADAIDEFFLALFQAQILAPATFVEDASGQSAFDREEAEAVLCGVAQAGGEVTPLLTTWDAIRTRDADLRLARMIVSSNGARHELANSWWAHLNKPHVLRAQELVFGWLAREAVRERLENACLREANAVAGLLLSQAEEMACSIIP